MAARLNSASQIQSLSKYQFCWQINLSGELSFPIRVAPISSTSSRMGYHSTLTACCDEILSSSVIGDQEIPWAMSPGYQADQESRKDLHENNNTVRSTR